MGAAFPAPKADYSQEALRQMARLQTKHFFHCGLAATAGSLAFAPTVTAALDGLSYTASEINQTDPDVWVNPDPRTLVLVSVYADFTSATDQLIAVYGDAVDTLTVTTTDDDGFWQFNANESQAYSVCDTSAGINPALDAAYPSQVSDSFVTIGLEDNQLNLMNDIGMDFASFNSNAINATISVDNGSWFCTPDDPQTIAGNHPDNSILIGQFAVALGESVSGTVNIQWRDNAGTTTRTTALVFDATAEATAGASVKNDLNGDGYSDLLLRNPNAEGGSDLLAWLFDGSNPASVTRAYSDYIYNGSNQLASWEFIAIDDFNGDGIDEPMFRTPANRFYVLNASYDGDGDITVGLDTIHSGGGYATWAAIGTGDFNGDGVADVLLRNPLADGGSDLLIFFLQASNPANITKSFTDVIYNGSNQLLNYEFLGVGDGNGDGLADMFWRTPANRFYCFVTTMATPTNATTLVDTLHAGGGYQTWDFSSLADVNGDGLDDVILRSPFADGASDFLAFILFNASPSNIVKSNDMIYNGGSGQSDWVVVGVGDFTGDGADDFVLRTPANRFYLWPSTGEANVVIGAQQTLHSGGAQSTWAVLAPAGELVP